MGLEQGAWGERDVQWGLPLWSHVALIITVFLSHPLTALCACAVLPIQSSGFFSKLVSIFKALGFPGTRTGSPEVMAGLALLSLPVLCTSC